MVSLNGASPSHPSKPACECCGAQGLSVEAVHRWEAENLEKYGFFMQGIVDDPSTPFKFNLHTHGLQECFNHPDLQIVFPLPPDVAAGILHNIVDRIREGEVFKDGTVAQDIVAYELPVKFAAATESGRQVLRVILPDAEGQLDLGVIADPFDKQYEGLEPA